ncbi:MAG: hypothetical protein EPN86_04765 [Nanoarchaeota archaeon]|nr:MAG: hypothetical protein EPN86_04765 [Nanoarchaeota archaeon]
MEVPFLRHKAKPRIVLYRADTLDRFTDNLMTERMTEPDFSSDMKSAGEDFDLERLLDTMHQTLLGKRTVETLLYRKSLRDLCIKGDMSVTELREMDGDYAAILVSGFNLLFNLSLSELFYRAKDFPEGISQECIQACQQVMDGSVAYFMEGIRFNEERGQFEDKNGQRVVRAKAKPFKQIYDDLHAEVSPEMPHTERSLIALYKAFASEYKRFKDDIGILKAATIAFGEEGKDYDSALMRLTGTREHLSEIKPNRLALRYFLARDILLSYSNIGEGYDILRQVTGQNVDMQSESWAGKIAPTKAEELKFGYIDVRNGNFGKSIGNFAFWNSLVAVAGVGVVQLLAMHVPEVKDAIHSVQLVDDLYSVFTHPAYKVTAVGLLLGVFDKLPAKALERQFEQTQRLIYS